MSMLFRSLGLLICGLVVVQVVLYIVRGVHRFIGELAIRRLQISKLREEIDSLRSQREKQKKEVSGWDGFRKFRVARKLQECDGCHSFYLVPHDGKPLAAFQPGQYLTFQLKIPGQKKPVVRCYSLSSLHDERFYRCTIKKMLPPTSAPDAAPGVSSTYFNDVVAEGDILDVRAPRGQFCLDGHRDAPVVLISGGVGITPMMSIAQTLLTSGSARPIFMFAGFPNGPTHVFKQDLQEMSSRLLP